MKTIALRFADTFAPSCGTIIAHEEIIEKYGYVWYGKLGAPISVSKATIVLSAEQPRILLINSGKIGRYWAYIDEIKRFCPEESKVPEYYRHDKDKFHSWFRVLCFKKAPSNIMSQCIVISSGATLSHASHYSMSPYFFIETPE